MVGMKGYHDDCAAAIIILFNLTAFVSDANFVCMYAGNCDFAGGGLNPCPLQ